MSATEININPCTLKISDIPILKYSEFTLMIDELFSNESHHCLCYFAHPLNNKLRFICAIGCDDTKTIRIISHEQNLSKDIILDSLTRKHFQFHLFEREIHENFGIGFQGHPWLKPVRYPFNRNDREQSIDNYPFYSIDGEELHEVGVGPIHAGIIEPGYFRFICNGEKVLHLEIQLGYQHRGVEQLIIEKSSILQKALIAEQIAGDTTLGHSLCFSSLIEALGGKSPSGQLQIERTIALELERIAVHIGDTAALCTDIAYQFGQVVNEALRTIVINTIQLWCGNRFGKGLIRPGGSHYPLNGEIINTIRVNLKEVEERYLQITSRIFSMPSVLSRFEAIGKVSAKQATLIGTVGMAARSSGLKRDIRWSHPFAGFIDHLYEPVVLDKGDVWSRAMMRKIEVERSMAIINELIDRIHKEGSGFIASPDFNLRLEPNTFAISMVEGWRGEICHSSITDAGGSIIHYKIKDPSFHNWMALALAVRGQEISDFPLCNKSYNLSYCGHDL